ncbi:MAG: ATP-binding protein [Candidatus Cryptobacteroides sp.]
MSEKGSALGRRLMVTVTLLFILFAGFFIVFQYSRERSYKIDLIDTKLQGLNNDIHILACHQDTAGYREIAEREDIRVTILDTTGQVLYDNMAKPGAKLPDHSERDEIRQASLTGHGFSLKRESQTLGGLWLYSATSYPEDGIIVRTSHRYDVNLSKMLVSDKGFLWTAILLSVALLFIFYRHIRHISLNINNLKKFAGLAASGQDISNSDIPFTNDELGEISSEIVNLYSRLQNSEDDKTRLKRQLTQNAAHELRTPVSSIKGFIDTIIDNPDMDRETMESFLGRCSAQCERLGRLTDDICTLSRIEEAAASFEMETIDVREMLDELASDAGPGLENRKMQLLILVSPGTLVYGNRHLVQSIFCNLLDNAIAYAGEGTSVTVQCRKQDREWNHFIFNDNGSGVPEDNIGHLFERFYRVDKGRSRKSGGTGLGLAIVKNAVMLHGGRISVRNGESGGLEFAFSLPRPKN